MLTMFRFSHLAAVVMLTPLAGVSPAANAAIPLLNGTCPGAIEVHADEGGPVYINGRQTQLKRFNDNYYEARDASSGVTLSINRSPDGGVQMSYTGKGGANGVCQVGSAGQSDDGERPRHDRRAADRGDGALPAEVTCESRDRKQTECDMDTRGDVRVVRQLSSTRCVKGENWDLNRHSIWVKDGCRAVFRNTSSRGRPTESRADGRGASAACDDRANAEGRVVTRVPVNEQVTELIIDYPDGRYLCMANDDGTVQSLTRMRRQP